MSKETKISAKAVIFDRDGVIVNTEGVVMNSVRQAFAQQGFTVTVEDLRQIIGRSSRVYKDYFLSKWDFDYEKFEQLQRSLFYQNIDSAPLFPETIALIRRLHSQGIPLAVTTSASREGTELILKRAGIDSLIKVIVSRDDCQDLKPLPEPYLLTARKLELVPQDCVAIEDTALGVESAKAAGMYCIAIPNEYTQGQDFSRADIVLDSAKEVDSVLEVV